MIFHSKTIACLGAVALLSSVSVEAQEAAEEAEATVPAPPEPCTGEAYRAFDFWVGEWDVHMPDGTLAGTNIIEPINGGCALLERYTVGGTLYGQSYNFYDPVRETWTQIWLSPGVIIRMEGPISEDGVLALHGTITATTQAVTQAFVGRWTLQDDGTVLQEFWSQNPESEEWTNGFTGIYSRTD